MRAKRGMVSLHTHTLASGVTLAFQDRDRQRRVNTLHTGLSLKQRVQPEAFNRAISEEQGEEEGGLA